MYEYRLFGNHDFPFAHPFRSRLYRRVGLETGLGLGMRLEMDRDIPTIHLPVLDGINHFFVGRYCEARLRLTAVDSPNGRGGGITVKFTGKRGCSEEMWHQRDEELESRSSVNVSSGKAR